MKKLLLTTVLLGATVAAFGQGGLNWGNSQPGFKAVIFGPEPGANSTLSLSGQTAQYFGNTTTTYQDNPVGTQVYNGLLLSGTGYTFAIFGGAQGSTANQLVLLASTTFNTTTTTLNGGNAFIKGYVVGGSANVPGVPAGSSATYQIRVWDNLGGTITTWAAAAALWQSNGLAAGESPLLTVGPLGGTDPGGNLVLNPAATGFTSFNIYYIAVPEPSMFALAGLGAAALLIFRRRQ